MIVAIDPGKNGGAAYLSPLTNSQDLILRSWTTESDYMEFLESMDSRTVAVVENVPKFVSAMTSSSSAFTLGYNFGFCVGALRAYGFVVHLVAPSKWQSGLTGLKPRMGYTDRKRALKDNAKRLYPKLKITNATADAVLILDWFKQSSLFTDHHPA